MKTLKNAGLRQQTGAIPDRRSEYVMQLHVRSGSVGDYEPAENFMKIGDQEKGFLKRKECYRLTDNKMPGRLRQKIKVM